MKKMFDVYPRFDIHPKRAEGVYIYDENDQQYLDLYGGHGVISIGHSHPEFIHAIREQLNQIAFYSNSVIMPLQEKLADKLSKLSGYKEHQLFLCNSGAEANENAIKLASFHTGRKKVIAFKNSFHGRTAAALQITDNPKLRAKVNQNNFPVTFLELNDSVAVEKELQKEDVCAIIVEGIQGVGGLDAPSSEFLKILRAATRRHGSVLILDEIQSGYGRTGAFFAHQHAGIEADLITMAKGMGNGFPIAGVLIHSTIKPKYGMLGTTFGGNHLACAAGISVLEMIKKERLMDNVDEVSQFAIQQLNSISAIKRIKGRGLMLGIELDFPVKNLRKEILYQDHIFTGSSADPNVLRILPPLSITTDEIAPFFQSLEKHLS